VTKEAAEEGRDAAGPQDSAVGESEGLRWLPVGFL
jgi:hypothetical protein